MTNKSYDLYEQESFFHFLPKASFGIPLDDNGCKTIDFIFVDHRHPNFTTEYAKVFFNNCSFFAGVDIYIQNFFCLKMLQIYNFLKHKYRHIKIIIFCAKKIMVEYFVFEYLYHFRYLLHVKLNY